MISSQEIAKIVKDYRPIFEELHRLRDRLCKDFHGMRDPVTALILAVAARETLLFIGPPGTAKSMLIRRLCFYLGMPGVEPWQPTPAPEEKRRYFEYLLTAFTEPGELFGFLEMKGDGENRRIERKTDNMILGAEVVYLDEVFNASSAILNSLLAFMNEGRFHDRGEIFPVAEEQLLFGASNRIPRTDELKAIYDRFLIRCQVNNLVFRSGEDFAQLGPLVLAGFRASCGRPGALELGSLKHLPALRKRIKQALANPVLEPHADFLGKAGHLMHDARTYGVGEFSNRRMIRMLGVLLFHCMFRFVEGGMNGTPALGEEELELIPRFFLDRFDDKAEVLRKKANPKAYPA